MLKNFHKKAISFTIGGTLVLSLLKQDLILDLLANRIENHSVKYVQNKSPEIHLMENTEYFKSLVFIFETLFIIKIIYFYL